MLGLILHTRWKKTRQTPTKRVLAHTKPYIVMICDGLEPRKNICGLPAGQDDWDFGKVEWDRRCFWNFWTLDSDFSGIETDLFEKGHR